MSSADRIADIAEAYANYLAGEIDAPPPLDDLSEDERRRAETVCATLAAAWKAGELDPVPLDRDPLAISLGLVPDPTRPLNGAALKQARLRAGLSVSELASRLRERGWETRTADIYKWEQRAATAVAIPPAIIVALGHELGVSTDRLIGDSLAAVPADVVAVTLTDRFRILAGRWAAAVGLGDEARGAAALQQLMLVGVVRRGEDLDVDAWLTALEALVHALERRGSMP